MFREMFIKKLKRSRRGGSPVRLTAAETEQGGK